MLRHACSVRSCDDDIGAGESSTSTSEKAGIRTLLGFDSLASLSATLKLLYARSATIPHDAHSDGELFHIQIHAVCDVATSSDFS